LLTVYNICSVKFITTAAGKSSSLFIHIVLFSHFQLLIVLKLIVKIIFTTGHAIKLVWFSQLVKSRTGGKNWSLLWRCCASKAEDSGVGVNNEASEDGDDDAGLDMCGRAAW
jgi:hypothetical protein